MTNVGPLMAQNNLADVSSAPQSRKSLTTPPYVATRTAMAALDGTIDPVVWLSEPGREGFFEWNASDVSAYVAPRSFTSTSVNSGTDTITSAGYRLKPGDSVIATATVDGLTSNTYYYAIPITSADLKLAATRADAVAASPIPVNLTSTAAITLKVVPDALGGEVVIKTGTLKDGTQGAWLRVLQVYGQHVAANFGLTVGSDNAAAINVASAVACETGGGAVLLPGSDLYMIGALYFRRNVLIKGVYREASRLSWYGLGPPVAFDATDAGTDGSYPNDRTIAGIEEVTLWGWTLDAGSSTIGISLENNIRAFPFSRNVSIAGFPNHGVYFAGTCYNFAMTFTQVQNCGRLRSNASGIFFNPACTDMAELTFDHCLIEGCGNSSSAAGGMNAALASASGNRGWAFTDCEFEGSFGTDEVFAQNITGIYFTNAYNERITVAGNLVSFEFADCDGYMNGAQLRPESGTPTVGIKLTGASNWAIMNVTSNHLYSVKDLTVGAGSVAKILNCPGLTTSGAGTISVL